MAAQRPENALRRCYNPQVRWGGAGQLFAAVHALHAACLCRCTLRKAALCAGCPHVSRACAAAHAAALT